MRIQNLSELSKIAQLYVLFCTVHDTWGDGYCCSGCCTPEADFGNFLFPNASYQEWSTILDVIEENCPLFFVGGNSYLSQEGWEEAADRIRSHPHYLESLANVPENSVLFLGNEDLSKMFPELLEEVRMNLGSEKLDN